MFRNYQQNQLSQQDQALNSRANKNQQGLLAQFKITTPINFPNHLETQYEKNECNVRQSKPFSRQTLGESQFAGRKQQSHLKEMFNLQQKSGKERRKAVSARVSMESAPRISEQIKFEQIQNWLPKLVSCASNKKRRKQHQQVIGTEHHFQEEELELMKREASQQPSAHLKISQALQFTAKRRFKQQVNDSQHLMQQSTAAQTGTRSPVLLTQSVEQRRLFNESRTQNLNFRQRQNQTQVANTPNNPEAAEAAIAAESLTQNHRRSIQNQLKNNWVVFEEDLPTAAVYSQETQNVPQRLSQKIDGESKHNLNIQSDYFGGKNLNQKANQNELTRALQQIQQQKVVQITKDLLQGTTSLSSYRGRNTPSVLKASSAVQNGQASQVTSIHQLIWDDKTASGNLAAMPPSKTLSFDTRAAQEIDAEIAPAQKNFQTVNKIRSSNQSDLVRQLISQIQPQKLQKFSQKSIRKQFKAVTAQISPRKPTNSTIETHNNCVSKRVSKKDKEAKGKRARPQEDTKYRTQPNSIPMSPQVENVDNSPSKPSEKNLAQFNANIDKEESECLQEPKVIFNSQIPQLDIQEQMEPFQKKQISPINDEDSKDSPSLKRTVIKQTTISEISLLSQESFTKSNSIEKITASRDTSKFRQQPKNSSIQKYSKFSLKKKKSEQLSNTTSQANKFIRMPHFAQRTMRNLKTKVMQSVQNSSYDPINIRNFQKELSKRKYYKEQLAKQSRALSFNMRYVDQQRKSSLKKLKVYSSNYTKTILQNVVRIQRWYKAQKTKQFFKKLLQAEARRVRGLLQSQLIDMERTVTVQLKDLEKRQDSFEDIVTRNKQNQLFKEAIKRKIAQKKAEGLVIFEKEFNTVIVRQLQKATIKRMLALQIPYFMTQNRYNTLQEEFLESEYEQSQKSKTTLGSKITFKKTLKEKLQQTTTEDYNIQHEMQSKIKEEQAEQSELQRRLSRKQTIHNVRRTITSINLKKLSDMSLELREMSNKSSNLSKKVPSKKAESRVTEDAIELEQDGQSSSGSVSLNSSKRVIESKKQLVKKIVAMPQIMRDLDSLSDQIQHRQSSPYLQSTEKKLDGPTLIKSPHPNKIKETKQVDSQAKVKRDKKTPQKVQEIHETKKQKSDLPKSPTNQSHLKHHQNKQSVHKQQSSHNQEITFKKGKKNTLDIIREDSQTNMQTLESQGTQKSLFDLGNSGRNLLKSLKNSPPPQKYIENSTKAAIMNKTILGKTSDKAKESKYSKPTQMAKLPQFSSYKSRKRNFSYMNQTPKTSSLSNKKYSTKKGQKVRQTFNAMKKISKVGLSEVKEQGSKYEVGGGEQSNKDSKNKKQNATFTSTIDNQNGLNQKRLTSNPSSILEIQSSISVTDSSCSKSKTSQINSKDLNQDAPKSQVKGQKSGQAKKDLAVYQDWTSSDSHLSYNSESCQQSNLSFVKEAFRQCVGNKFSFNELPQIKLNQKMLVSQVFKDNKSRSESELIMTDLQTYMPVKSDYLGQNLVFQNRNSFQDEREERIRNANCSDGIKTMSEWSFGKGRRKFISEEHQKHVAQLVANFKNQTQTNQNTLSFKKAYPEFCDLIDLYEKPKNSFNPQLLMKKDAISNRITKLYANKMAQILNDKNKNKKDPKDRSGQKKRRKTLLNNIQIINSDAEQPTQTQFQTENVKVLIEKKTTKLYDPRFTPKSTKEPDYQNKPLEQSKQKGAEIALDETLTGKKNKDAIKEIQMSHPYKLKEEQTKQIEKNQKHNNFTTAVTVRHLYSNRSIGNLSVASKAKSVKSIQSAIQASERSKCMLDSPELTIYSHQEKQSRSLSSSKEQLSREDQSSFSNSSRDSEKSSSQDENQLSKTLTKFAGLRIQLAEDEETELLVRDNEQPKQVKFLLDSYNQEVEQARTDKILEAIAAEKRNLDNMQPHNQLRSSFSSLSSQQIGTATKFSPNKSKVAKQPTSILRKESSQKTNITRPPRVKI